MAISTYDLRYDSNGAMPMGSLMSDISVILTGDTLDMTRTEDALARLKTLGEMLNAVDQEIRSVARTAVKGATWQQIGDALGVSRQAAHKRFSRLM